MARMSISPMILSASASLGRTLTATMAPEALWRARNTWPKEPSPSMFWTSSSEERSWDMDFLWSGAGDSFLYIYAVIFILLYRVLFFYIHMLDNIV